MRGFPKENLAKPEHRIFALQKTERSEYIQLCEVDDEIKKEYNYESKN